MTPVLYNLTIWSINNQIIVGLAFLVKNYCFVGDNLIKEKKTVIHFWLEVPCQYAIA